MYNSERARERRENRDRPGTDDAMMGERCKAHAGERCRGAADDLGPLRNVEYSLLNVMSELSTMRCDRVLGL